MERAGRSVQDLRADFERILQSLIRDPGFLERFSSRQPATVGKFGVDGFHFVLTVLPPETEHPLTEEDRRIVALVGRGLGNKGIAKALGRSPHTVANHLKRIYRKWGINSRAQLARCAAILLVE
jgi:DNA-binding NarL/FixJ family response regulator